MIRTCWFFSLSQLRASKMLTSLVARSARGYLVTTGMYTVGPFVHFEMPREDVGQICSMSEELTYLKERHY